MDSPENADPGFAAESGDGARSRDAPRSRAANRAPVQPHNDRRAKPAAAGRAKWLGFGVAAAILGGALSGVASADNVSIGNGAVETSSAAITAVCNAPPLAITASARRTTYSAVDGYWISQIPVTAIPAACQSKPYELSLAENTGPFPLLADWSANTPGAATGTLTAPSATDGVDINSVPSVAGTDVVRVYVLVRTS